MVVSGRGKSGRNSERMMKIENFQYKINNSEDLMCHVVTPVDKKCTGVGKSRFTAVVQ